MAGRPRNSPTRISNATDPRLKWFSLKKYSPSAEFTDLQLHFQILCRRELFKHLDVCKEIPPGETPSIPPVLPSWLPQKINCVLKDPIVTLKTIQAHGLAVSGFWFLSCFLTGSGPLQFVQQLGFSELTKIFEGMLLAFTVNPPGVTNRAYSPNERESVLRTQFANRDDLCRNPWIGSTKIEDLHSLLYPGEVLLKINLQAPRWQLERELETIIRTLHKNQPFQEAQEFSDLDWKPRKKKHFTPAQKPITKSALLENQILPYLDLTIWEEEHGLTIADATKARLLFSDSIDGFVKSGQSWAKNWIREAESLAWSVLTYDDLSYFDLERRADEELQNAYTRGYSDGIYIPTPAMRAQIDSELRDE